MDSANGEHSHILRCNTSADNGLILHHCIAGHYYRVFGKFRRGAMAANAIKSNIQLVAAGGSFARTIFNAARCYRGGVQAK